MSRFQRALNFVEGLALDDRRHPGCDHLRRGLFPPGFRVPSVETPLADIDRVGQDLVRWSDPKTRAKPCSNAAGIQGLDHLLDTQRSAPLISFKAELEDQPHGLGFNSVERFFPYDRVSRFLRPHNRVAPGRKWFHKMVSTAASQQQCADGNRQLIFVCMYLRSSSNSIVAAAHRTHKACKSRPRRLGHFEPQVRSGKSLSR